MKLAELTWPDVPRGAVLAVPLGATEQHGPHLPTGTDTAIAVALAERLAAARPDVIVAPALPYGSSGEHAMFPGTLSIGQQGLETVVTELVRSADAFAGTVLVCAHGGNAAPLARAVATLVREGRRALAWSPQVPDGDAHAGRTETSLMLALSAERVRRERAAAGDVRPLAEVATTLRTAGVAAVSANGVLGDPTGATAAEGEALLDALAAALVAAVDEWAGGAS
ncbi:MAG TPA: mycofactocin biosynthesis peptidyl-dipeptidase MftE [Acidimicrobiales bacterium]|nr:mycofactocin biosynthesis peptidyl-dipeptidase MftE [Acidimicrobiales bacterium]